MAASTCNNPTPKDEPLKYGDFQPGQVVAGLTVKEMITFTPDYVVVACVEKLTYYQIGPDYSYDDDEGVDVNPEVCDLLLRADILSSLPLGMLRTEWALAFVRAVAYAQVAALEKRFDLSQRLLSEATRIRNNRIREMAQLFYLSGCSSACLVFCLGGFALQAIMAMSAGSIGSLFFSVIRRRRIRIDREASRDTHAIDGCVRALAGIVSGLVALAAIESQVVFAFTGFSEKGQTENSAKWLVFLLCFMSGYSERFIPGLLGDIEGRAPAEGFLLSPSARKSRGRGVSA
jgi:hypothetical protein